MAGEFRGEPRTHVHLIDVASTYVLDGTFYRRQVYVACRSIEFAELRRGSAGRRSAHCISCPAPRLREVARSCIAVQRLEPPFASDQSQYPIVKGHGVLPVVAEHAEPAAPDGVRIASVNVRQDVERVECSSTGQRNKRVGRHQGAIAGPLPGQADETGTVAQSQRELLRRRSWAEAIATKGSTLRNMAERELVTPPAVQINTRRIVWIGTSIWFVAFVVLLPWYGWLGRHHHRIWLWTCLAGCVLGMLGSAVMMRHRRAGRTV